MCSNTFLLRAFARLRAFYFAPLASPPYLTFAVSPCFTWKTCRNWITGNDDLRTNGLSGDGISCRRGKAPHEECRRKKGATSTEARNVIDERSIDSSSRGVSLEETFVLLPIPRSTRAKIELRCHRYRKSLDMETRRDSTPTTEPPHYSRHPPLVVGAIPASSSTATVLLRSKR